MLIPKYLPTNAPKRTTRVSSSAYRVVVFLLLCCVGSSSHGAQESQQSSEKQVDGTVVPTGQILTPAGERLTFPGRPNSLCYFAPRDLLFVKNHRQLLVVSGSDWKVLQTLDCPGGASLNGIAVDQRGTVYVSNAAQSVHVFAPSTEEAKKSSTPAQAFNYILKTSIELASGCYPCGLTLSPDEKSLFVCLSKANAVAEIDLSTNKIVATVDVGIAPFEAVYVPGAPNRLFVSNLGGRRATEDDKTATSAGTATPVDERGIANTSLISVIDLTSRKVTQEATAKLHPTDLVLLKNKTGSETILVTNSNDDSLTLIDSQSLATTSVIAKPIDDLPFGSMPNSACVSNDKKWLFVGLAGNNAIAVYDLATSSESAAIDLSEAVGFIPTDWFPAHVCCNDDVLFVANLKGIGARAKVREVEKGGNSHDHEGSIQKISLSGIADMAQLATWTEQVKASARILPVARLDASEKSQVAPVPMPKKLGEPSTFKHVIYVIKENRTYDQVFGDMEEGRGEPTLCLFPEINTPNHHALARRFGLLDNYYCNGVLSADGHSWATEANVTPYLERAFGGFARSYTFGDDPLTYSSSGFIWDHVLAAGLTFRNYGEMDYAKPPAAMDYQAIWKEYKSGKQIQFSQNIGIEKLRRYSSRNYPGWNMSIPDVLRMDRFLEEFETFRQDGTLPNFSIIYLPEDHLGGGVTSAAHMADNDLALGRLVDAVSHSDYWKDTVIIANEDDPQNGYDHIDGHRSVCLVISAYSKPGVNHRFYNQTSAVRSMLHILGLPPMNQQDGRSPLMNDCFTDSPNLEPYVAIDANFPLNQRPGDVSKQSSTERRWRKTLATVPIERTGMKTEKDEDNLNRFVWHEMKGWETPYPIDWAGPHGKGLSNLGLTLDPDAEED